MIKTYKYKMYPNNEQKELINKTIGCNRFVFNYLLNEQVKEEKMWAVVQELVNNGTLKDNNYKDKMFDKFNNIKYLPELKKHHAWLKEVDSISLQAMVERLAGAYKEYYGKTRKHPRFKTKINPVQSYTTKNVQNNICVEGMHIKLPKMGYVRIANSQDIPGKIKTAIVTKKSNGKYFVSVTAEVDLKPLEKVDSPIGIDVGISYFASLSNGVQYDNLKTFKKYEYKLSNEQRKLSRKIKGSSNYKKQQIKVANVHEKISNVRMDYIQKVSTEIIKNHDLISMEKLNIKSMMSGKTYSKVISDASWGLLRDILKYKALWYGREFVLVDPKYTSQTCNHCKHISKDNRKTQSKFNCVSCGYTDNADINAAKNIRDLAICA